MDNEFIFKQLLAIDELKPSSITSGIAIFGEVYARAILRLLSLLGTEEKNEGDIVVGTYFFNPEHRTGLLGLLRAGLVGISYVKSTGNAESSNSFYHQGNTYRFCFYYQNILHPGRKWTTVENNIPLTDIAWYEQIYNCLCRELEEKIQSKEVKP